jgi:outer membrane protein OmpA-like peptidoglycan-associated protein
MSRDREQPVWTPSATPSREPDADARPLEEPVRSRMESKFGEDFSTVRVHSGRAAGESARGLGARAYAVGEDVTFGPGQVLDAPAGEALLEHELGHVVEQRRGAPVGVYRAPEGETEARAEETAPALGRTPSFHVDPKLGSLSLGLSTIDGFDFNKWTLKDEQTPKITDVVDKLTMLLVRMPAGRISVTGYTDLVGGEQPNLRLGLRRAEAVANALVKAGVPEGAVRARSEGMHAPVVQTAKPEARNRRVEVRFEGELVTPGTGPMLSGPQPRPSAISPGPLTVGERPHFELFPQTLPSRVPPFAQRPAPTPAQAAKPEPKDTPTRTGSAGDVLKAVSKIPEVDTWIEQTKREELRKLDKLSTGEKIVGGITVGTIAVGTAAGISTDPAARKTALDMLDGTEIPVPGAPWLKLKAYTKGGPGGGVQLDLVKIFPGLK